MVQLNSLYQFIPYIVPLYSDKGEWQSLVPLRSRLSYLIERVQTFSGKARNVRQTFRPRVNHIKETIHSIGLRPRGYPPVGIRAPPSLHGRSCLLSHRVSLLARNSSVGIGSFSVWLLRMNPTHRSNI